MASSNLARPTITAIATYVHGYSKPSVRLETTTRLTEHRPEHREGLSVYQRPQRLLRRRLPHGHRLQLSSHVLFLHLRHLLSRLLLLSGCHRHLCQLLFWNRGHVSIRREIWMVQGTVPLTPTTGYGEFQRSYYIEYCGSIPPNAMANIQPP